MGRKAAEQKIDITDVLGDGQKHRFTKRALDSMSTASWLAVAASYLPPEFQARAARLIAEQLEPYQQRSIRLRRRDTLLRQYAKVFHALTTSETRRCKDIETEMKKYAAVENPRDQRAVAMRVILNQNDGKPLKYRRIMGILNAEETVQ